MSRRFTTFLLTCVLGSIVALPVLAQQSPPSRPTRTTHPARSPLPAAEPTPMVRQQRADALARDAQAALQANDLAKAEQLLLEQARLEPESWIPRYNLASALARAGRGDDARAQLQEAIDLGFYDLRFLKADPSLAAQRQDAGIAALIADWPAVLSRQADRTLASLEATLGPGATITRDEDQRFIYANWADERSFARAHAELRRLAEWADSELFMGIADDPAQFDPALDPIVVVALPPRNRFNRWIAARFGDVDGQSLTTVAGAYEHLHIRLVSMDLGASLRHEFFHALHWRIANRLGQRHPIWLLEGLASLVEDMDSSGPLRPVPSWRTNTARRMLRIGTGSGLLPLDQFIAITSDKFNGQRPLAKYAQARAFFLFLHDRALLQPFLKTYCTDRTLGYAADPSGTRALEHVASKSIATIDKDFRAWLRELPEVSEEIKPGQASLGISIESGNGDGVIVVDVPARSGAGLTPLRVGDIILALDDQATRDIAELIRVLGSYTPGQRVTISLRREGSERTIPFTLVPK